MRRTDVWMRSQMDQNVMVKTANMVVISQFGTKVPSTGTTRNKDKKDMKFVVGVTKVGGEEVV